MLNKHASWPIPLHAPLMSSCCFGWFHDIPLQQMAKHTMSTPAKSPADDLICPITLELPWDPVVASDGRVYDQPAIEEHIKCHQGHFKSPLTNQTMDKRLLPAPQIKSLIETLVENGVIGGDLASKWNEKVKEQKRVEALLKKAQGGDAEAMYRVGISYLTGTCGFEEDEKLAVKWFTKSHEAGYVQGTAALGYYMCNGYGVAKCHSTGIAYIGIAAGQGSDLAAFVMGMALADGKFGLKVNKNEAIYWLEKAAGESANDHLTEDCKDEAKQKLNELQA
jgi:U-box domain/Sel1 repeat